MIVTPSPYRKSSKSIESDHHQCGRHLNDRVAVAPHTPLYNSIGWTLYHL